MMKRRFRYRAYLNKKTELRTLEWINSLRFLYNSCLAQRIDAYRKQHKTVTYNEQQNELTELRAIYSEYKDISVQVERDVIRKLDHSYRGFFRRLKRGERKTGL